VSVATHAEGYTTFTGIIPAIAFHVVSVFLGMVCIGLGQRKKRAAAQ
jgi:hypothetical protein